MEDQQPQGVSKGPEEQLAVIRFRVPDRAVVDVLAAKGMDLCECVEKTPDGYEMYAVVTADELAALHAAGFEPVEVLWSRDEWKARVAERNATVEFERRVILSAAAGKRKRPGWAVGAPPYLANFISHYMDPTELYQRAEALAREFPDLAEMVAMPYETNGYRRPAQALLGSTPESAVVVTSRAWGHEGGNDLSIEVVGPESPGHPLSVAIDGKRIAVKLGAGAAGKPNSTAAQVVAALNQAAGDLIVAQTFRGNAGSGLVVPVEVTPLSDHLSAPPEIARAPFKMQALRIGKYRDGSRPGVLIYAQEHAREWVTPLITLEIAERLLRNYGQDANTRLLVDGVDLFLMPSSNPDGAHFSFYDYGMQRKNMVFHTGAAHAGHSDPELRNYWGTDLNRNYSVGSLFDGFEGASAKCYSQVYAGPAKLSEAESQNLLWLVEQCPNIRYAANLHSFGGYIMWPPGADKADGRDGLAHLTPEQEALFKVGAERMAEAIKVRRGTVIPADHMGTGVDVMYSSAGNSADHLWYLKGVFAWSLEVGGARPDSSGEPRPVGFQPGFAEGREEAMEFADGLIALLALCSRDDP